MGKRGQYILLAAINQPTTMALPPPPLESLTCMKYKFVNQLRQKDVIDQLDQLHLQDDRQI